MPNYCIGDVQGCLQELQALVQAIAFDPQQDRLWFTGDLVNRGPASLAVLRWIRALGSRAIVVLGNHDLHLLAVASGRVAPRKQDTFSDVLNAPDGPALCDWLRQQPLLYHEADLGYTLVHAGLPPQWDLTTALQCAREVQQQLTSPDYADFFSHLYGDQPDEWQPGLTGWGRLRLITNYLTRLRFCTPTGKLDLAAKGKPHNSPHGYLPWFQIPNRANRDLKILFGHWAALNGKANTPNIYALDTGCAWGNCLTAMRLEDGERTSVPCNKLLKATLR